MDSSTYKFFLLKTEPDISYDVFNVFGSVPNTEYKVAYFIELKKRIQLIQAECARKDSLDSNKPPRCDRPYRQPESRLKKEKPKKNAATKRSGIRQQWLKPGQWSIGIRSAVDVSVSAWDCTHLYCIKLISP